MKKKLLTFILCFTLLLSGNIGGLNVFAVDTESGITPRFTNTNQCDFTFQVLDPGEAHVAVTYDYEYKVSSVVEYAGESTLTRGQTLNFTYNDSSTSVRSSGTDDVINTTDDIITNYVYDSTGRTVTVYSTDTTGKKLYGASSAQYVDNVEKAKNSVKASVSTSGTYSNYLKNGGFEAYSGNTFTNWTSSGNVVRARVSDYPDTSAAQLIVSSSVSNSYVSQSVTLPAGDFALSFKADSTNTDNAVLSAKVVKVSDSSVIASKEYPINTEYQTPGEIEYTLCFTTTTSASYRIIISLTAETGISGSPSVLLDDVMLAKSITAASYSSVEEGGFENSVTKWTPDSGSLAYVSGDTTFGKSLVVGTSSYNTVEQVIYSETYYSESVTNPTQYAQYTLFGWLKNNSGTYLDANPKLKVVATYHERSEPLVYSYDFAKDVQNWQYGSVGFVLDPELGFLTELKIVLEYSGACGSVVFDDIVLLKNNNNAVSYNYNTSGYVTDVHNGTQGVYYRYTNDNTGDVELAIDSYGTVTGYKYDAKRRPIVEITYKYHGTVFPEDLYDENLVKNQDLIVGLSVNGTMSELYIVGYTVYEYNDYGLCEETRTYSVKEIVNGILVGRSKVYYQKAPLDPGENHTEPTEYNATTLIATAEYLSSSTEYNTTAGSFAFGAVTSETDTRGKITTYFYDNSTGYLSAIISPEGYGTAYTYDTLGNIEYVLPAEIATNGYTSESTSAVQYVYDSANRLEKIKTETTEYAFSYDNFGNTTGITASGSSLATYKYNSYNGKLNEIDYGNGFKVKYVYDSLDRIKEIQYNTNGGSTFSTAYRYEYGALGEVIGIYDVVNDKSILTEYDPQGRVVKTVYADGEVISSGKRVAYDENSRVTEVWYELPNIVSSSSDLSSRTINNYSYNSDGDIKDVVIQHNNDPRFAKIIPTYDPLGRISSKTTTIEKNNSILGTLTNNYVFYNGSYLVSDAITKVAIGSSSTATELTNRKYYYDDNGNITEITTASGQILNKYYYDTKGQLYREDNLAFNVSYKWTYDDAGNILTKSTYAHTNEELGDVISSISYGYASGTDKLTSYNGQSITYDAIGNPLTYKGNTLTWKNGRELATYGNYSFDYDANGIRVRKANGTNITNYTVDGSIVLRQSWASGSNSYIADYIYTEAGTPLAFALSTNGGDYVYYFYETNIQGDVIAVYDSSWNKIVSFSYDAWGNFTPTINNSTVYTSNFQKAILFRYRGYIYDTETQLYYLQSRYYDPAVGRFINADGYVSTGTGLLGYNMYAYCKNNPSNYVDFGGNSPTLIVLMTIYVIIPTVLLLDAALSELEITPVEDELYDSDRFEYTPTPYNEKAFWYSVNGGDDGATIDGTSIESEHSYIEVDVGLSKAGYYWDYFEIEGGVGKASGALSTNFKEGTGLGASLNGLFGSAKIKIPIFNHSLSIGVEGTVGSIGAELRIGKKTKIGASIGVGGNIIIEWD